ncbi:hypothetical protein D1614_10150 [Maribellus luteus]|uniref:DUF1573 domain-containing protein n=1 Tax=Maribellus luteus TaxID=2305463 RepID=A0A399SY01_9BACT|nr:hypothetical protein [Maribellus luteus]RIJ48876.1 hypothetical protein D1614_10150 [Maribellus luteus]
MKKLLSILFFSSFSFRLFAQNEVGPDGDKLVYIFLVLVALIAGFIFTGRSSRKTKDGGGKPLFGNGGVRIELGKSAIYYPDRLTLTVKNTGKTDIDLARPLLVFDNFWIKRKFRLKGSNNYVFYPLYLEKGKTHTLEIDLRRFYGHDDRLKKFPKAKIYLEDVKGKKLGSRAVFLRKTAFKF